MVFVMAALENCYRTTGLRNEEKVAFTLFFVQIPMSEFFHQSHFSPLVYNAILLINQSPVFIRIYLGLYSGPFNLFLFRELQSALIY